MYIHYHYNFLKENIIDKRNIGSTFGVKKYIPWSKYFTLYKLNLHDNMKL